MRHDNTVDMLFNLVTKAIPRIDSVMEKVFDAIDLRTSSLTLKQSATTLFDVMAITIASMA